MSLIYIIRYVHLLFSNTIINSEIGIISYIEVILKQFILLLGVKCPFWSIMFPHRSRFKAPFLERGQNIILIGSLPSPFFSLCMEYVLLLLRSACHRRCFRASFGCWGFGIGDQWYTIFTTGWDVVFLRVLDEVFSLRVWWV